MSKRGYSDSSSETLSPISNSRRRLDFCNAIDETQLDGAQPVDLEGDIKEYLQEFQLSNSPNLNHHIVDLHTEFGPDLQHITFRLAMYPEDVLGGQAFAIHLRRISEHLCTFPQKCQFIVGELKNNIFKIHCLFLHLLRFVKYTQIEFNLREIFYIFLQGANDTTLEIVESYIWLLSAMNVLKFLYKQVYPSIEVSNPQNVNFFENYDSLRDSFADTAINIHESLIWDFRKNNVDTSAIVGISQLHVIGLLSSNDFSIN